MILKGEHLFVTGGAAGIGEALVIGGAKRAPKYLLLILIMRKPMLWLRN